MDRVPHLPRLGLADAMRLFGMTARALRFYEERGLVTAGRDRLNARYYDPIARQRLAWISCLRGAGLSLADVADVLAEVERGGRARERAVAMLERRKAALDAEALALGRALESLRTSEEPPRRAGAPSETGLRRDVDWDSAGLLDARG